MKVRMKRLGKVSVAALFVFGCGKGSNPALESAKAKLDARGAIVDKAVQLAKDARTLDPAARNEDYIREDMSRIKGDRKIVGWTSQFWDLDGTVLVEFTYERNGEIAGYPFEVNQPAGIVRGVIGDPELEKNIAGESPRRGWLYPPSEVKQPLLVTFNV